MLTTHEIIKQHPFFGELPSHMQLTLAGLASRGFFTAGEMVFHEGEEADRFYIIGPGQVALAGFVPGHGRMTVQTLHEGEILGWSWLFAPYRWHFDAQAITDTQIVVIDGKTLRAMCETDHDLGYELMKRFAQIILQRLQSTRMRLLDLYETHPPVHQEARQEAKPCPSPS